jgi:hypothetical protein
MDYVNHSDKESVQKCSVCDKPLSDDSKIQIGHDLYCQNCAVKFLSSLENLSDKEATNDLTSKIKDNPEIDIESNEDEFEDESDKIIEDNPEIDIGFNEDEFEDESDKIIEDNSDIEEKYEKYLKDLDYDEKETKKNSYKTSLKDQLKDYEQKHGSITKNLEESSFFLKTDNVNKTDNEKHDKINKLDSEKHDEINKLDEEKNHKDYTDIKSTSLNKTSNFSKSLETNEKTSDSNEKISLNNEIPFHNKSVFNKNNLKFKNKSKLSKNFNNSYKEPKNYEEINVNKNEDSLFIKIIILIIFIVLIMFIIYYIFFLKSNFYI